MEHPRPAHPSADRQLALPAMSEFGRNARRAAERQKLREAIEALRRSDGWKRWLRARGRFRTYSFHNQLMIAFQCPDATKVAGFRAWMKLGYCVRKGEKAIRIWAPCPPGRKRIEQWQRKGADPDSRPRTYFRLVPVFDRSQVDPLPDFPGGPAPLDPPGEPLAGNGLARHFEPLAEFGRGLGLTVDVEPVPGSAAGYHEPSNDRVVVDVRSPTFSPNAQVSTLVHEIAHALVRIDRLDGDPKLPYAEEEVVAESVAFAVCSSLGLDTSANAVPYLAGWDERSEGDPIESYAALIDRLARRIEGAVLPEQAVSGPRVDDSTQPQQAAVGRS
jgi:antirestriction protein ArdC